MRGISRCQVCHRLGFGGCPQHVGKSRPLVPDIRQDGKCVLCAAPAGSHRLVCVLRPRGGS